MSTKGLKFCSATALTYMFDLDMKQVNAGRAASQQSFPSFNGQLLALTGITAAVFLLAVMTAAVRLASSRKRFLAIKQANYRALNTPLIAAISIAIYSILAIAGTVLAQRLVSRQNVSVPVFINILGVLPAPIFIWAWSSAYSSVNTCHIARHVERVNERRSLAYLSLSPRAALRIGLSVPIIILLVNLGGFAVAIRVTTTGLRENMHAALVATDKATAAMYVDRAIHTCARANAAYQAIWAVYGCAFLLTVVIYLIYTLLTQANLQDRLTTLSSSDPPQEMTITDVDSATKGQLDSAKASADIMAALRQSLFLSRLELVAFTVYCGAWIAISWTKTAKGMDLFILRSRWGVLLLCELYLAAACAFIILTIFTWRDIVLWRARLRVRRQRKARIACSTLIEVTVERVDVLSSTPRLSSSHGGSGESDSPSMKLSPTSASGLFKAEEQMIELMSPIVGGEKSLVFPEPIAAPLPRLYDVDLPILTTHRTDSNGSTSSDKACEWRPPANWLDTCPKKSPPRQ